MEKNYKNKMIKEEKTKSKVEDTFFFFPSQDGYSEFSCQAASLEEAEEKYKEFKSKTK